MSDFVEDDLKRVASLVAHGVTDEQICTALGIEQNLLDEVKEDAVFKNLMAEKTLENYELEIANNEGWDAVERQGLEIILDAFKWNKNPEFALKAASLANKMERRNVGGNKQIDASNVGPVVVVQLNQKFVNQLNGAVSIDVPEQRALPPRKQTNMPTPDQVQKMFSGPDRKADDAEVIEESLNMDMLERQLA